MRQQACPLELNISNVIKINMSIILLDGITQVGSVSATFDDTQFDPGGSLRPVAYWHHGTSGVLSPARTASHRNELGRAYSRPTAGTAKRPEKNTFGTPHVGACFQRCLLIEIGRFAVDSSQRYATVM